MSAARPHVDRKVKDAQIALIKKEIKRYAPKKVPVDVLADITGVSQNFITRNVRDRHETLNRERIKIMLKTWREGGAGTIEEMAKTIGRFKCYETFYRNCLKLFGKKPEEIFTRR